MANRGMSAGMLTDFAAADVEFYYLIELLFATPIRETTHHSKILYAANNYVPLSNILGFTDIVESLDQELGTLELDIAASDAMISAVLGENITFQQLIIRRATVNNPADAVIDYDGRCSNYRASEDPETGENVLILTFHNQNIDFNKVMGRRANDADQQALHSGDKFFEFSGDSKDIKWGYT